jgi:hypothetical protein
MAYTVSGNGDNGDIIDLKGDHRSTKQYGKVHEEKFTSGICEKIIVVDPRLDKSLQINVGTGTISHDVWVTTTSGPDSADITAASVPWVQVVSSSVADYLSGGADINKGILAIRILSASVASDSFKICVSHIAAE